MEKIYSKSLIILIAFCVLFTQSCEKMEEVRSYAPVLSFAKQSETVKTDTGSYDLKLVLSKPAQKEIKAKVDFTGTAIEGEHYTVVSKEVVFAQGEKESVVKINILNENIYEELLSVKCLLSPGTDYSVEPELNSEFVLTLTKEIILPTLSFKAADQSKFTNPYLGETLTFELNLTEALRNDSEVRLNVEGGLTIGTDFLINSGNSNTLTIPKSVTSKTFTVTFKKKDKAGYDQNLKLTLVPVTAKSCIVKDVESVTSIIVKDPVVDMTPFFKTAALLSGSGYQMTQAIKATDGTYVGTTVVNVLNNSAKANYMRSYRNLSFNTAFGCNSNSPGGDVLRLSDLLNFSTTDTVVADYGVGKTTRYFSPSDSLLRFVADGENIRKGKVFAPAQKFRAKLVLKADWETGTNGNKQWHLDSKATGGNILLSTYPLTFATMDVELVRLEGTFDMTEITPVIYFDAWFKSSSKYFMKNVPVTYGVVKEGDLYKVSYRYTPK